MGRWFFVSLVMSSGISAFAQDETDDWIGLNSYGGHLGVHWGAYQSDSQSYAVNLSVPLFFFSQLNAFYSDYKSSEAGYEQESQQLGLYWNSDPFQTVSWGVGYLDNGRSSDLRTTDYTLYLQYLAHSEWNFKLLVLDGKSVIDANGFSPVIENQFRSLGLHEIARQGWGASFGFDGLNHGFRVGATIFEYDEPGSASRSQIDQFVDDLTTNEERFYYLEVYLAYFSWFKDRGFNDEQARNGTNWVFQNHDEEISDYVNSKVDDDLRFYLGYDQKATLSNHEIALDYFYSVKSIVVSTGVFIYESYISEEYSNQSYASVNYQATEHYSYGFTLSYSDENAEFYGELSLGLDW